MIYIFLAEGFEEVEALAVVDVLRRANLDVKTVGVTHTHVTGAHQITVTADLNLEDIKALDDAEALILPGGQPGTDNLMAHKRLHELLMKAFYEERFIAAICAAPIVLDYLGITEGKELTCYPTYQDAIKKGVVVNADTVVDGKLITGRGVGVALEFGLEIVKAIKGEALKASLFEAMVMK